MIGGTGVYQLPGTEAREESIETPYGPISVTLRRLRGGGEVVFAARHGAEHSVPPHRLPARALIWALKDLGVTGILATSAVGSLTAAIPPGTLALLGDFIDMTKSRPTTFYDGPGVVHVDVSQIYCTALQRHLRGSAERLAIPLWPDELVYVCTEGPRFETPAEIRAYHMLGGHLVGMTQVPEAVLARELGICYATLALVTNLAAGVEGHRPSHAEVLELMAEKGQTISRLLLDVAEQARDFQHCSECPLPEAMG